MLRRKDATGISAMLTVALFSFGCMGLTQPGWETVAQNNIPGSGAGLNDSKTSLAPEMRIPTRGVADVPTAQPPADIQLASATGQQGPDIPPPNLPPAEPDATAKVSLLYREAAERYTRIDSYIVRFRRREQINGKDKPEELIMAKFRKNPSSVYFKWLGPEAKGREVIYVKDHYEDKIHTLVAAGDVPLMSPGKRFAVSPDSPLVMARSRYSIRQSGVGPLIEHFGRIAAALEKGETPQGSVKYLGRIKRPEFDEACEAVEQRIPKGSEAALPGGGTRLWMFNPTSKLPVLVVAQDETGHEVEYYCYDLFQFPVKLDDVDFNPDILWKDKR
jgi:hypothetical protein